MSCIVTAIVMKDFSKLQYLFYFVKLAKAYIDRVSF